MASLNVQRHRIAFPGTSFIAHDGQRMSDRDDNREWDYLWRTVKARHRGTPKVIRTLWDDFTVMDYQASKDAARAAARRLRAWYVGSNDPHSWVK